MEMVFRIIGFTFLMMVCKTSSAQMRMSYLDSCVHSQMGKLNKKLYHKAERGDIYAYWQQPDSLCVGYMVFTPEDLHRKSYTGKAPEYVNGIWQYDTLLTILIDPEKDINGQRFQFKRDGDGFLPEYFAPLYGRHNTANKDTTFYWLKWQEIMPLLDSSEKILLTGMANLAFRQYNWAHGSQRWLRGEKEQLDVYSRFLFTDCMQLDFIDFFGTNRFWDSLVHQDLAMQISKGLMGDMPGLISKEFGKGYKQVRGEKKRGELAEMVLKSHVVVHPLGTVDVFIHVNGEQWQLRFDWTDVRDKLMPFTRMLIEQHYFSRSRW